MTVCELLIKNFEDIRVMPGDYDRLLICLKEGGDAPVLSNAFQPAPTNTG